MSALNKRNNVKIPSFDMCLLNSLKTLTGTKSSKNPSPRFGFWFIGHDNWSLVGMFKHPCFQATLAPTNSLSTPFEVGVVLWWLSVRKLMVYGSAVGIVALNTRGLVWYPGMKLMIIVTRSQMPMIILVSVIRLLGRVFSVISMRCF